MQSSTRESPESKERCWLSWNPRQRGEQKYIHDSDMSFHSSKKGQDRKDFHHEEVGENFRGQKEENPYWLSLGLRQDCGRR